MKIFLALALLLVSTAAYAVPDIKKCCAYVPQCCITDAHMATEPLLPAHRHVVHK